MNRSEGSLLRATTRARNGSSQCNNRGWSRAASIAKWPRGRETGREGAKKTRSISGEAATPFLPPREETRESRAFPSLLRGAVPLPFLLSPLRAIPPTE
jgi:hypothetical protein